MKGRRAFIGAALAGVAARAAVAGDGAVEAAEAPAGVTAASAFEIEPQRVWSAPNGKPIMSIVAFDGRIYVAAGPDLYVSEAEEKRFETASRRVG